MKTFLQLFKKAVLFVIVLSFNPIVAQECDELDPIFSQFVYRQKHNNNQIEIANPGKTTIDLSNYAFAWLKNEFELVGNVDELFTYYGGKGYDFRYSWYIPGYEWVSKAEWTDTDNPKPWHIVRDDTAFPELPTIDPGETFVLGAYNFNTTAGNYPMALKANVIFENTPANQLGTYLANNSFTGKHVNVPSFKNLPDSINDFINSFFGPDASRPILLFKILNPDIKAGLKGITDPNDFELIDMLGNFDGKSWKHDSTSVLVSVSTIMRKPEIWKGNPVPEGSFGPSSDESEWTHIISGKDGLNGTQANNAIFPTGGVHSFLFARSCELSFNEDEMLIVDVDGSLSVEDFKALLLSSPNGSITIVDAEDNEVVSEVISENHKVKVVEGSNTVYYGIVIDITTKNNNDNSLNGFVVYPNPTKDVVYFSGLSDQSTIEVRDITGRLISSRNINDGNGTISLKNQPNGIYFFTVIFNGKVEKSLRLLKTGF